MRASKQLTYSVLGSFRFAGRNYEPGMEFNARRLDPNRSQLQRWVDAGLLVPPGQEPQPEPEAEEPAETLESDAEGEEPEAEEA